MSNHKQIVVKTYTGSQEAATARYRADAAKMATQDYFPTSQTWAPGAYSGSDFLVALLLCLILIGIIVFVYMLLVQPDGTLSVTYEYRPIPIPPRADEEKTCPKCAEQIKSAAVVCRFCGHHFGSVAR